MIPVLLIDDDERLGALLIEYLVRFGFEVKCATHPEAGLRMLKSESSSST
jgi:DNA-binding response OmpR family regulator